MWSPFIQPRPNLLYERVINNIQISMVQTDGSVLVPCEKIPCRSRNISRPVQAYRDHSILWLYHLGMKASLIAKTEDKTTEDVTPTIMYFGPK